MTDTGTNTGCGLLPVRSIPLNFSGQGQWPWHVALYQHQDYDTVYRCGGTFVGTKTIITGMFMYCLCSPSC